ncbi:MAG: APC family permease [Bryobacteraceae bacterium]|nr:APC family permease [Bryobacteraceae bacterium]
MADAAPPGTGDSSPTAARIVVATTVALAFISFWRGAAIVLSDLASTMFYVGGIAERAIGKPAPWFILAVMLFSFAVRSVYMESCSMFVRGGVYVVVRDSLGAFMAKVSVSALVVDYILTGPISSVSAGQYLGRLLNELSDLMNLDYHVPPDLFAAGFGVAVTLYFWWANIKGIHESSGKALRIMQITTVMVVVLLVWCPLTILLRGGAELPPAPTPDNLRFTHESLGWLDGTFWPQLAVVALLIAFGHSLLAMSGFETLAQVYREIAHPKLKNLRITANIVCFYAMMSTGLISLFAVIIIPDETRPRFYDNLIGGLSMHLAGPEFLRLAFHAFVVLVGTLILSGAVNTSLIGANGVLNRVAEDGVLLEYFRKPHRRFGTTFRIVNLVAFLQIGTILASRGDVYLLGEAYAFGVVWSFFLKGLGVSALRFQRRDQEYKTPGNIRIGKTELPVGLIATTLMLLLVALANLFTKKIATIYGITFSIVLLALFTISDRVNARRRREDRKGLEEFNLEHNPEVTAASLRARPGCVLVAVRDYSRMDHLKRVLRKTNIRRHDIVVMTVRPLPFGTGEYALTEDQFFSDYEQELFTHVVTLAEKEGKPVELLVVPAVDPFDALVQTAANLKASRLVTGVSAKMPSEELARRIGLAWEKLPEPRLPLSLEVISPERPSVFVNLGPHPPRLWPEDVDRLHELWLELTERAGFGSRLHHRDVVGVALRRLESDLDGAGRAEVIENLRKELRS